MELNERVGPKLRIVGSHHASGFVDPNHRRHIDDVIEVRQPVLRVDETRMGGVRPLDVGSRVLDVAIERHSDRHEPMTTEFLVQCLPDRQVLAAASPGRVGDEKHLLAPLL